MHDLIRGTETRISNDASDNGLPFWSPQGDRIVFTSTRTWSYRLYQKAWWGAGRMSCYCRIAPRYRISGRGTAGSSSI